MKNVMQLPKFKDVRSQVKRGGSYKVVKIQTKTTLARHHSATTSGDAISFSHYHVDTLGWPSVGYHFVIPRDGTIQWANSVDRVSYNVGRNNTPIVGICVVGNGSFTMAQEVSYQLLVAALRKDYPGMRNHRGHNEFDGHRSNACPGISMNTVRSAINAGRPVGGSAASVPSKTKISDNPYWDTRGKNIEEVQDLLLQAGEKLPLYGADGHFGSETLAAVQSFQKKHDISSEQGRHFGVPGPQTMEKLSEVTESKVTAKAPEEVKKEEAKDPRRLHTGTFPTAEALANGIKRLEKEFGWIFYERAESTKFNAGYRIFTGVYPTKEAAERAAERIRELTGWLVYVIEV